ncbi:MAG: hypothetical protein FAF05_07355, partial [Epsilonproteobacteria bacterium]|nr:hypothetical protein [Campylobacterota bacterium]
MKIVKWLAGIVVVLVVLLYTLLFTSIGNSILAPVIESKINDATKLSTKLQKFSLSMSDLDILLYITPQNSLRVTGSYSPFSQSFDLAYDVACNDLSELAVVVKKELSGKFLTDGKVKGDMEFLMIDGKSDIAKSATSYHVELTKLNPTSIIAKVQNLDLATLLAMVGEKQYASAKVALDVNFKNITPHQLDGDVVLRTSKGVLNSGVMRKDFGITIPKTSFAMQLNAKLQGDDIVYRYLLTSNLAKISSSGKVVPQPLDVAIKYGVDVQELAVLKPITKADIRGELKLSGSVDGDQKRMGITAKSDVASSYTTAKIVLQDFKPQSVVASIQHLKVQKLLYMVKQPHYTDADINVEAKLSSVEPLKGTIVTHILKGKLDSAYLSKTYKFKHKMPTTTYNGVIKTKIANDVVDSQIDFNSNLANLDMKQARFNIQDASLQSDYVVKLHDLNRLYFVTDRYLKGGIVANGMLKKAKDLDFTAFSNIAGGKLDVKLHNDDLVANISSMRTLDLLDMLLYPQVFDSAIDGDLKYNLAKQSGVFDGKLKAGKFMNNVALDLTKKYAKIDLYKQRFQGDMQAEIKKELITASVDLKSNTSSIATKNTKLNAKTQSIDSKLKIIANNNPAIYVTLKGGVSQPKVSVDASGIVKDEAKKVIK